MSLPPPLPPRCSPNFTLFAWTPVRFHSAPLPGSRPPLCGLFLLGESDLHSWSCHPLKRSTPFAILFPPVTDSCFCLWFLQVGPPFRTIVSPGFLCSKKRITPAGWYCSCCCDPVLSGALSEPLFPRYPRRFP